MSTIPLLAPHRVGHKKKQKNMEGAGRYSWKMSFDPAKQSQVFVWGGREGGEGRKLLLLTDRSRPFFKHSRKTRCRVGFWTFSPAGYSGDLRTYPLSCFLSTWLLSSGFTSFKKLSSGLMIRLLAKRRWSSFIVISVERISSLFKSRTRVSWVAVPRAVTFRGTELKSVTVVIISDRKWWRIC